MKGDTERKIEESLKASLKIVVERDQAFDLGAMNGESLEEIREANAKQEKEKKEKEKKVPFSGS